MGMCRRRSRVGLRAGRHGALEGDQHVLEFLEPIFLSYPVPKAVSLRFGLGAQVSIRSTM